MTDTQDGDSSELRESSKRHPSAKGTDRTDPPGQPASDPGQPDSVVGQPASAISISPLPVEIALGSAQVGEGLTMAVIQMVTPQGSNVFFLTPDQAQEIGTGLMQLARQLMVTEQLSRPTLVGLDGRPMRPNK